MSRGGVRMGTEIEIRDMRRVSNNRSAGTRKLQEEREL